MKTKEAQHFVERGVDGDGGDGAARHHDLAGGIVAQLQDIPDGLLFEFTEVAFGAAEIDDEFQLLRRMSASVSAAQAEEAREGGGGPLDDGDERGGEALEKQQGRGHQQRQAVRFIESEILRDDLANHDVGEADDEEGEGEGDGVKEGNDARDEQRMRQAGDELVDGIFARPAEAETGERDADLGDGKQPRGLSEQTSGRLRGDVAAAGEGTQPALSRGDQGDLGRGEKSVHGEDEE